MEKSVFENKVALITGGSMGIGQAIADKFRELGCKVVIFGRKPTEDSGFYACDVSNEKQVQEAVSAVVRDYGKIDFLVNNAGIYPAKPALEMDAELFDCIFAVNVRGTFLVTREVVKQSMMQEKAGKIICISSVDGWLPSSGITAYAASKAAVNSLVKSFAIEFAPYNITANGVAPGWVATQPVLEAGRWKTQIDGVLKKRMATPEEIGEMVTFLCEKRADYMNGEIVNFSGGLLLNA